jgi:hypothetical protein
MPVQRRGQEGALFCEAVRLEGRVVQSGVLARGRAIHTDRAIGRLSS